MNQKQHMYRCLVFCVLFLPAFYVALKDNTVLGLISFLLAVIGIRSICFWMFPNRRRDE